jgi:GntR family transcriptional regulator
MPVPKYSQIAEALQARIDRRQYRVGALIPSEAQLTTEFAASRATVVRALRQLTRQGWLRGVQGKGRIVLGRPADPLTALPGRLQLLLQSDRHAVLLGVYRQPVIPRIAKALHCPTGTVVIARRYRLALPDTAPFGLATVYIPESLTSTSVNPSSALLSYLEQRNGLRATRVVERLTARLATASEMEALREPKLRSVAVSLLTVLDGRGVPFLTVEAVLSRDADELATTYEV